MDGLSPHVQDTLETLPVRPGCYVFRGKLTASGQREVLYVGKAKSLRSRVRSYFQEGGSDVRYFIPFLRKMVEELETVVTSTEKEAAILENSLIKQHKPRFNVKLRDDKEFLSIKIDDRKSWPRIDLVRKPARDGAKYYGPFHSATSARRSLQLINKHFQLRTCSDQELTSRSRPCLQHHIKRCPAPCVYDVDRVWYADQVHAVGMFLEGRHDELTASLEEKMKVSAGALEFELAGVYRDQLRAVSAMRETQRVVTTGAALKTTQDAIGVHREGELAEVVMLRVRYGRLADTMSVSLISPDGLADAELIGGFVREYYGDLVEGGSTPPDEILVAALPDAAEGVEALLSDAKGSRVRLICPQRGPRADLVRMAVDNAKHAFSEKRREGDRVEERLEEIRIRLQLKTLPRRIECCDISHLGGEDTVGAIVCLIDGVPAKDKYRSFHVKTTSGGDDYGAIYEVLSRRFRRALEGSESATESGNGWEMPDLFIVDGGKGQLSVALAAAHDLGLHDLAIVGLAKEKTLAGPDHVAEGAALKPTRRKGKAFGSGDVVDRVVLPGVKDPIELRSHSGSLVMLARARDEAHRFANLAREKLGAKRRMASEKIAGIGEETRKLLLRKIASIPAIFASTDAELLAIEGITTRHVRAIRKAAATTSPIEPPFIERSRAF